MGQIGTAYEMVESRRGGGDITTGDSWEMRKYKAEFSDTSYNSLDARNASGVPAWGSQLGSYSLYVLQKDAEPDKANQRVWIITVTYRTLRAFEQQPKFNSSSNKWSILKSVAPYPVENPVQRDLNGSPIVNCLNEPIQPILTVVDYDLQINVSYLTNSSHNVSTILLCLGLANLESQFLAVGGEAIVFEPGTLKLNGANIQELFDNDGNLISKTDLQFLYRVDGWVEARPNLSFNHRTASGGTVISILKSDVEGVHAEKIDEPRYLDADGIIIPSGELVTDADMNFFLTVDKVSFDALFDELI